MSLSNYINNIQLAGYYENPEPFDRYSQLIVVSKAGEFPPISFEIISNQIGEPLTYYPETDSFEPIADNNPSLMISQVSNDPYTAKATFILTPTTSSGISCDGAIPTATLELVLSDSWTVQAEGVEYVVNGITYTPDTINSNGLIVIDEGGGEFSVTFRNISSGNVRVKYRALPVNQDMITVSFLDNDTAGKDGQFATVCLSPVESGGQANFSIEFVQPFDPANVQIQGTVLNYTPNMLGKEVRFRIIDEASDDLNGFYTAELTAIISSSGTFTTSAVDLSDYSATEFAIKAFVKSMEGYLPNGNFAHAILPAAYARLSLEGGGGLILQDGGSAIRIEGG